MASSGPSIHAKRALIGAIISKSGHCLLKPGRNQRQEAVDAFLRQIRRAYQGPPIFLLFVKHPSHTALGCLTASRICAASNHRSFAMA
jgi:hypothetical protein